MPSRLATSEFDSPRSTRPRMKRARSSGVAAPLLVLGHLGVRVGWCVTHDDGHLDQPRQLRCAPATGAEVDAIAPVAVNRMHDDGLENAALTNVLGQLGEFILGQLRARVARVLMQSRRGDEERLPRLRRRSRCSGLRSHTDYRLGVQQIELFTLRFGPWHAHGRMLPIRSATHQGSGACGETSANRPAKFRNFLGRAKASRPRHTRFQLSGRGEAQHCLQAAACGVLAPLRRPRALRAGAASPRRRPSR